MQMNADSERVMASNTPSAEDSVSAEMTKAKALMTKEIRNPNDEHP